MAVAFRQLNLNIKLVVIFELNNEFGTSNNGSKLYQYGEFKCYKHCKPSRLVGGVTKFPSCECVWERILGMYFSVGCLVVLT